MSFEQCPVVVQDLIIDCNRHPFKIGDEFGPLVYDNIGVSFEYETKCTWIGTSEFGEEIELNGWQHEACEYEIVDVQENTVSLQAFTPEFQDYYLFEEGEFDELKTPRVDIGPVFQREVQTIVDPDGMCSWWIVIREPVNSSGGGPQTDDQLNFSPMEILDTVDHAPDSTQYITKKTLMYIYCHTWIDV